MSETTAGAANEPAGQPAAGQTTDGTGTLNAAGTRGEELAPAEGVQNPDAAALNEDDEDE